MKQGAVCAIVPLVLLGVSLAAGPDSARAQGGRDWHRDGHSGAQPTAPPGFVAAPVAPRPALVPRPGVVPRPFAHRPFTPSAFGVPVYVPVSPEFPDSGQPPTAYDPATVYVPPMDMAPVPVVPSPPPPPSVIEYPMGRYELRGDGVMTPYTWVWIPNPPPAPPAGPSAVSAAPRLASPEASPVSSDIYRFTDEQGVVTWTDRWDSIPERYRSHAKRLPL